MDNNTQTISAEFVRYLNRCFSEYRKNHYFTKNSPKQKEDFVAEINTLLKELAGRNLLRQDPFHPLTEEIFGKMLAGEVGITPEILKAMPHALKLIGDLREHFLSIGEESVKQEKQRRHAVWLESPEGQEALLKKKIAGESETQTKAATRISQARIANNAVAWRANNPTGLQDKPSFQEMLEESYARDENFGQFLFKRVMPTWNNMSQVAFCEHIAHLNQGKPSDEKGTLTDSVLSQWRRGYGIKELRLTSHPTERGSKPLRASLDVIRHAFGIEPAEGYVMAEHEKMLWKTINGHPFQWGNKKGIAALEDAINDSKNTGDTSALVCELIDASGIRFERLKEALHIQQIPQWRHGAKIESVDVALQFLQLVNPQPTEAITGQYSRQNIELLKLITGREFDINTILADAKKQGNPGGALLLALTGRGGIFTIKPAEISAHFAAEGLVCTQERVKKMRTGTQLQRGGRIKEEDANAILKMMEDVTAPMIKLGICKPFTEDQKESCVETFTGVPHPKKMLQLAVYGKLPVGQLVGKTCDRRGLSYLGANSFCEKVGISHISDFVLGKANLERETAEKIANWFEENYAFDKQEKQQFIALAQGINLQRKPDEILDDVIAGKITRIAGLRAIYDYPGLSRPALAAQADVDDHIIQYSVQERSGSRIMTDKLSLRRIGNVCGISSERMADFIKTYDGHHVARQSALHPNGKDSNTSWQQHISTQETSAVSKSL